MLDAVRTARDRTIVTWLSDSGMRIRRHDRLADLRSKSRYFDNFLTVKDVDDAKTPADKIAANQQLDSALGRLLVVVENYPQLKSNENFLRLQDELAGTENRIAVAELTY